MISFFRATAALAVLAALTILTLVLPHAATSVPGPLFNTPQLVFVAIVSLALYGSFIFGRATSRLFPPRQR